jgi:hypothetical protein
MPWVEFELMILGSERAKTLHALDLSATVTGSLNSYFDQMILLYSVAFKVM